MTAPKRRLGRKVRWPFCCSRCGVWIASRRKYSDDGIWWICEPCALERALSNITEAGQ